MKHLYIILGVVSALFFAGCKGKTDAPKQSVIKLTPDNVTIASGDSITIKSNVKGVVFSSQDSHIAPIDNNGQVRGVIIGTTTIKAMKGNDYALCRVTVTKSKNTLDVRPVLDWGISRESLKEKMSQYNIEPREVDGNIAYIVDTKHGSLLYLYQFDEDGLLENIIIGYAGRPDLASQMDMLEFAVNYYYETFIPANFDKSKGEIDGFTPDKNTLAILKVPATSQGVLLIIGKRK